MAYTPTVQDLADIVKRWKAAAQQRAADQAAAQAAQQPAPALTPQLVPPPVPPVTMPAPTLPGPAPFASFAPAPAAPAPAAPVAQAPAPAPSLPPGMTPGMNSAYLAQAIRTYGPQALPPGYTIQITSTDRPGARVLHTGGVSQHSLGKAVDFQIIDPNGNPLPNQGDVDPQGLYGKTALAVRAQLPPNLVPALGWGGNFTTGGDNDPRDFMHLDWGGDRGRYGTLAGMAGAGGYTPTPAGSGMSSGVVSQTPSTNAPSLGSTVAGQTASSPPLDPSMGRTTDLSLPPGFMDQYNADQARQRGALAALALHTGMPGLPSLSDTFNQAIPQPQLPQSQSQAQPYSIGTNAPGAPLPLSRTLG